MPEKLQTIIFLVRHGQTNTDWQDNLRVDSKRFLTDDGRRQLKTVGRYLADFQPAALFTSPLQRCSESAKLINKELSPKLEIQSRKELLEYYSPETDQKVTERMIGFVKEVLRDWSGQQIVAVTHQDPIQFALAHYFKKNPIDFPCVMSDIYRLVFAYDELIEATRLQPAKSLSNS